MRNKIITTIIIVLAFSMRMNAEIKNIQGEYVHVVQSNESQKEAMVIAERKAREVALEKAFTKTMASITVSEYDSETEQWNFKKVQQSVIAGKWLADTRNPEFEILEYGKKIKVKVWGQAKALKTIDHNCEIGLLREELKPAIENAGIYEYYDKDHFYLKFSSPISGYLTVYGIVLSVGEHVNRASDEAFRLLPYSRATESVYAIEAGKEYILFSPKNPNNGENERKIDHSRFLVSQDKKMEYNRMYVIFSPNEFSRPADKSAKKIKNSQFLLPRSLNYDSFNNWLLQMESVDDQLQVEILDVIVRNAK